MGSVLQPHTSPYTTMDLQRILSELRTERQQIDDAIALLERVQGRKRQGRLLKAMTLLSPNGPRLVVRTRAEGSSSTSDGQIPGNTASG